MTDRPLLRISGLVARYSIAQILFGLDFVVAPGEAVALAGRNGAGKTTTLKAIMGLIERQGEIQFRGIDISAAKPYEIARLGLGYVPEDRRIFTDLTVLENLEVGRKPPQPERMRTTAEAWTPDRLFDLFPNLAEARNRAAGHMSGGEQQMLTIARTLMGNPVAILLDEPSEGIAPVIVDQIAQMILRLKSSGISIILSEQNLPFAAQIADRAYVLQQGEIKYAGVMTDLLRNEEARRAYLEL